MKVLKHFSFVPLFLVLQLILFHTSSCKKDYSFEGGDSLTRVMDTLPPIIYDFSPCILCNINEPLLEGKWNFKTGNSYLCGNLTDGIITSDKNAFTFFGPSACSIDSGLVITAYLDAVKLQTDMFNLTTNKVAFYYYDHNATNYIFISQRTTSFSLTIDSFIYQTGIATGSFSGSVFKVNGDNAFIKEGKFKVKLRK